MVQDIRLEMPRVGTRKLYHMFRLSLKEKKVGRDKLFNILRANRLLIRPCMFLSCNNQLTSSIPKAQESCGKYGVTRPEEI